MHANRVATQQQIHARRDQSFLAFCHLQTSAGHHIILATAVLVVIVNTNLASSIALPLLDNDMTRMMEWYYL
jgi:hypothetical protein